ncbi:MAG: DUF4091 domain-containing protein [Oscillospiraceae bacterium]|nr:DUF4091 domain-containing protein [Oscillospiraceae bacterium]
MLKLRTRLYSSLVRVRSDSLPDAPETTELTALCGEEISFQFAFWSAQALCAPIRIAQEDVPVGEVQCFRVEEVPLSKATRGSIDDWYETTDDGGQCPDVLRPYGGEALLIRPETWYSIWIAVGCDTAGTAQIAVELDAGTTRLTRVFTLRVIAAELPEQKLIYTDWFHSDCLATYYNVPVFSEAHWDIIRRYVQTAADHGQNMILTPLFTPALDTEIGTERPTVQLTDVTVLPASEGEGVQYAFGFVRLRRFVNLCHAAGIRYFELCHLFTQWGALHAPKIVDTQGQQLFGWDTDADSAEYAAFLRSFAASLLPELRRLDITENCFVHVSDEPSLQDIESYGRHAALIKEIFPGLRCIDALSEYEFYQTGLIETPIPSNLAVEPFIGNVPHLWTYYCCGQGDKYVSNRFMSMPLVRTRVLGLQLWKFRCEGFLHWGYNFWYSQLSKDKHINPYEETAAGGAFPSGDAFVVYPGEEGRPLVSLRLKVFHEALQDYRALSFLEGFIGYHNTLALLEEGLSAPITFRDVPHDPAWLLDTRERLNTVAASLYPLPAFDDPLPF